MTHNIQDKLKGLWYALAHHTRKNNHMIFYMWGYLRYLTPRKFTRYRRENILAQFYKLPEWEQKYVLERIDYYCKFEDSIFLPADAGTLREFTINKRQSYVHDYINSAYFFDAYEYTRFFPKYFKWAYNPGDVNYLFPLPEITKSRPITPDDGNRNNILLNLDKVRHFTWVHDPFCWEDKECKILFRGDVRNKPRRIKFLEMWQNHPLCDLASTGNMTIFDHLYYKYIMALEGNDVASNLKWVMSSNSIAVMPRPTCETWFMEGKLIPNYHYIEIAADYHDLIDRVMYYENHPDEAKAIIQHAHEWTSQFRNKRREKLISLMVLNKYFTQTGQMDDDTAGNRHYIVNDLVKLNAAQEVNAQGKAREDVLHTLNTMGYRVFNIVNYKYSWGKYKAFHHYPILTYYYAKKQANRFIEKVKEGDTVFIQDFHLEHMQQIATQCLKKNVKVILLVHDIQCIRFDIKTNEVEQVNNASRIIVHTEAMKNKLLSLGVTKQMKVINFFDYYSNDPMLQQDTILKYKNNVVFAGNLTKSTFLNALGNDTSNEGIRFRLYGILGDLDITSFPLFCYCGVFQPANTGCITGGWGLVWDGDSIDSCTGDYGDYLRYNSSHKTSLYLACGIPLIVWSESALADTVDKENIGITVPNLHDLPARINAISDDDYKTMIDNAQRIGAKIRAGKYLREALNEV